MHLTGSQSQPPQAEQPQGEDVTGLLILASIYSKQAVEMQTIAMHVEEKAAVPKISLPGQSGPPAHLQLKAQAEHLKHSGDVQFNEFLDVAARIMKAVGYKFKE